MMLLDTCVLSEVARSRPDPGVIAFFEQADGGTLYVSVLTMGELARGIALLTPGRRRDALGEWLAITRSRFADRLVPVDASIAERWGDLGASASRQGRPLAAVDSLLAATALERGLVLVTRNERDFETTGVRIMNPWRG